MRNEKDAAEALVRSAFALKQTSRIEFDNFMGGILAHVELAKEKMLQAPAHDLHRAQGYAQGLTTLYDVLRDLDAKAAKLPHK
jgi:hypothetical protein